MKAVDYFNEYEKIFFDWNHPITIEEAERHIRELFVKFGLEVLDTAKKRNISWGSSLTDVVKEHNDKFNSMVSMFEKKYGFAPMDKDWFVQLWNRHIPPSRIMVDYYDLRCRIEEVAK